MPRDANERAFQVVQQATGQATPEPEPPDTRNQAAVALSKLGASKGGQAGRPACLPPAAALSPRRPPGRAGGRSGSQSSGSRGVNSVLMDAKRPAIREQSYRDNRAGEEHHPLKFVHCVAPAFDSLLRGRSC